MNGVLCSQSEARPWWKLLKTIAGIEAHELNTQTWIYTTLACWTEVYGKLQMPQLADRGDKRKQERKSLSIQGFRYFTNPDSQVYVNIPQVGASGRYIQNGNKKTVMSQKHLWATLSNHMYTLTCKGFCCILPFFNWLNVAIFFPKNRCCGPGTAQTVHYEVIWRVLTGILHELCIHFCAYPLLFIMIKYKQIFGKNICLWFVSSKVLKISETQLPAGSPSATMLNEVIMNELTVYSQSYKNNFSSIFVKQHWITHIKLSKAILYLPFVFIFNYALMEKQHLFLNLMNSNCSISNEYTLQYMTNFRIYKYQWSLQLAEHLPGRERWANLHFLRVKWEMFRVYGKTYLFQLTYTITWYMSLVTWQCYNNLVTRAQGGSLNNFPIMGDDLFSTTLTETLKS